MTSKVLHVIPSFNCPFLGKKVCSRCYVNYNIKRGIYNPNDVLNIDNLNQYLERFNPDWVAIGGGEPLFYFETTLRIIEAIRKITDAKIEVTTSGYDLKRLRKIAEIVDHIQLSIGDRYVNPAALEMFRNRKEVRSSMGFSILLSEDIIFNIIGLTKKLIKRYRPDVIMPIVPRIYRLKPKYFKLYLAKIPTLFALTNKYSISLIFDCITAQIVFDYVPQKGSEKFLFPDGSLRLCSTYPNIEKHELCPDVITYKRMIKELENY